MPDHDTPDLDDLRRWMRKSEEISDALVLVARERNELRARAEQAEARVKELPSPEAIEAAKDALRELTSDEAASEYEGRIDAVIHCSVDTLNEARAALAKLEGRS